MFNWVKKPDVAVNVIARKLTAPRSAPWLIAAGLGLQSLSLSAQELEASSAVRDTFSISSAYLCKSLGWSHGTMRWCWPKAGC